MKHLVIGLGEVGKAIETIFGAQAFDSDSTKLQSRREDITKVDVMHICFPYFEGFEDAVNKYRDEFHPEYTVVHSTVPIGTCEKLGVNHSPVRGKHPNLVESLKIFKKFIAGPDVKILVEEFEKFGIPTYGVSSTRDTEAMKLWDTTQYGAMIMLEKEIHDFCEENNLDFETVYTEANRTYNDGYEQLGLGYVRRPVLQHQPGKIGGHCVVENCKLLDSPTAKRVLLDN
jgi:UDP-N-acetyl-D-mannosaminuronate dehydrogenase